MKVLMTYWHGNRGTLDLATALAPDTGAGRSGGIAEAAHEQAGLCSAAIGCLTALLVEKKIITLEEAIAVSGNYFGNNPELIA